MQAVKLRNEGIGRRKRLPVPSEEVLSRNMSSEAAGGGYRKRKCLPIPLRGIFEQLSLKSGYEYEENGNDRIGRRDNHETGVRKFARHFYSGERNRKRKRDNR